MIAFFLGGAIGSGALHHGLEPLAMERRLRLGPDRPGASVAGARLRRRGLDPPPSPGGIAPAAEPGRPTTRRSSQVLPVSADKGHGSEEPMS